MYIYCRVNPWWRSLLHLHFVVITYGKVSFWLWKSLENSRNFFSYFVATPKKQHMYKNRCTFVPKNSWTFVVRILQCVAVTDLRRDVKSYTVFICSLSLYIAVKELLKLIRASRNCRKNKVVPFYGPLCIYNVRQKKSIP